MDIDRILKEKGMTKVALAEKMGIRSQNVNASFKNPTEETLKKLASALEVPMWKLFASESEVQGDVSNKNTIVCPKCSHEFEVDVKLEPK